MGVNLNALEKTQENIVPMKKELENGKKSTCKVNVIDIFRFMSSSLSNRVSNLSEGLHNDKCKDCKSCLEYNSIEDNQLKLKMQ